MTIQHASEWLKQGWLEGELPELSHATAQEFIERVGAHIYQDFVLGFWSFDECDRALQSLNVLDDLWLEMPFAPEPVQ